jgi:hypothetical protein
MAAVAAAQGSRANGSVLGPWDVALGDVAPGRLRAGVLLERTKSAQAAMAATTKSCSPGSPPHRPPPLPALWAPSDRRLARISRGSDETRLARLQLLVGFVLPDRRPKHGAPSHAHRTPILAQAPESSRALWRVVRCAVSMPVSGPRPVRPCNRRTTRGVFCSVQCEYAEADALRLPKVDRRLGDPHPGPR